MTQMDNEPVVPQPAGSLTWYEAWTRPYLRPSPATFEEIIRDPLASTRRAYLWVFVASLIAGLLSAVVVAISGSSNSDLFGNTPSFLIALCCLPLAAVFSVLSLVINAGLTQLVARLLGGKGTYALMVYALAAISAPLIIISGVLSLLSSAVPILGAIISFPLSLYSLVLEVMAIKAVNGFDWGRAILTIVILLVAGAILVGCIVAVVIAILAASGSQIQDIFQNVLQGMGTPMP